jgi:hypothetical protein
MDFVDILISLGRPNFEELMDELVELESPETGHANKIMTTSSNTYQKR